jgi:periplasmic divalent cation tolerance protein
MPADSISTDPISTDPDALVVFVTAPDTEVAAALARAVVEEGLAACGNLVPGLRSIYRWQGEICDEAEVLILFKTRAERFEALRDRIEALHPYDCPEVIALPVVGGSAAYLQWIAENTA